MPTGLGEGFTTWLRVSRVSLPSPPSSRMQQAPSRDRPVTPLSSCGRGSSPWAPAADRCTTPPRRAQHETQTTPCHAFSGAARNPDHPRHAFSGAARNPDHPRLKRNNNIRRFTRSRGGPSFIIPSVAAGRGGPGCTARHAFASLATTMTACIRYLAADGPTQWISTEDMSQSR